MQIGQDVRFKPTRCIASLLMIGVLFAYGFFLSKYVGAYAAGSDSSGYMNNARLLAERHLIVERRTIDGTQGDTLPSYTYIPLGFSPVGTHQMVPTYPMGFSLLILGMSNLVGWERAAGTTMVLHALGSIVVLYCLAMTCGLSQPPAFLGAMILGSSSAFIHQSLQAMSDVPALTWCSLAILLAWYSRRDDRWAFAAGVAVAMSVLVRPTDTLVMVPVGIAIGLSFRRWIWLLLGGLPGAIFIALVNLTLYGKPLTTGYGDVGGLFSFKNAVLGLAAYAQWLPVVLTPAVVLLVASPFLPHRRSRLLLLLSGWVLVLFGFYAPYRFTHESWTDMRFPMPAFAAVILLMLFVYQAIFSKQSAYASWKLSIGLSLVVLAWNGYWISHLNVLNTGRGERAYFLAADWAKENLPANSTVVAMQTSGALLYYTKFTIVRWDQFTKDTFIDIERRSASEGSPIYAVLFPFERAEVLEQRMPGEWSRIAFFDPITIWRRDASLQN